MPREYHLFTHPRLLPLRWMCRVRAELAPGIAAKLLEGLFSSPLTVLIAVLNGCVLNVVALILDGGREFAAYIAIDVLFVIVRMLELRRIKRRAASRIDTPADLYLLSCMAWCANQGAMGFSAMETGVAPVQVICAMTIVGLVGPICMRNFGAPRYAFAMLALTLGPLVCGAALSRDPWLLILAVQAPAFMIGASKMLGRLQALTISTLAAEQESQERARRDSLTGLLNRRGLSEAIEAAGDPTDAGSTFFYVDLDGFKPINDLHGHQAGDAVLKAVADRLRSAVRPDDVVGRLGGDEFMIVAFRLADADGDRYASRIIAEIATEPYSVGGLEQVRVCVSVGFARSPEDGRASDQLAQRADAALYEAKAAGKGVYRRYRPPTEATPPSAPATRTGGSLAGQSRRRGVVGPLGKGPRAMG